MWCRFRPSIGRPLCQGRCLGSRRLGFVLVAEQVEKRGEKEGDGKGERLTVLSEDCERFDGSDWKVDICFPGCSS